MIRNETEAELTAKYAARKAELHRQLDHIAAWNRRCRPVTIPPTLRQAGSIDRDAVYRLALPDGRVGIATGAELMRVADDLTRLAGALEWGGEPTIRRCLWRLRTGADPGPRPPSGRRAGMGQSPPIAASLSE